LDCDILGSLNRDRQIYSVAGSALDGTLRKLRFQLRVSKQSFGKVRSQAEPGNECDWPCGPKMTPSN